MNRLYLVLSKSAAKIIKYFDICKFFYIFAANFILAEYGK